MEEENMVKEEMKYYGPDKKNNLLKGIIIISVVMIVLGCSFIGINLFLRNDKTIVKTSFEKVFKQAKNTLQLTKKKTLQYDLEKESIGVNAKLSFESDYKSEDIDLSKLKDYEMLFHYVIAKKDNKASANFQLNHPENGLDIKSYIEGKNAYISLGDLSQKILSFKLEKEIKDIKAMDVDFEDIEKILKVTEKTTLDFIKEKDISSKEVEKEIHGKKRKYKQITYQINVNEYLYSLLSAYRYDEEILEIISKLTDTKKYEIEEEIKNTMKELKNDKNDDEIIINTYLSGIISKVQALEIIIENDSLWIEMDNKNYIFKASEREEEVFNGSYKVDNETTTLELKVPNEQEKILIKTKNLGNDKYHMNIEYTDEEYNLSFDIDGKETVNSSSQEIDSKVKVSYKDSVEDFFITLNYNIDIEKDAKVEEMDTSNSTNIENIEETEYYDILSKLEEKIESIMNDISPSLEENTSLLYRFI